MRPLINRGMRQPLPSSPKSAHVLVIGNEKDGSGKSTTCMHIAVALLQSGQRIATVDLDSRQRTLTNYINNRRSWATRSGVELPIPTHYALPRGDGAESEGDRAAELAAFDNVITSVEHTHDFLLIDTPGINSELIRLAHSLATTVVTPLSDSFVDLDVLATVDPTTLTVAGLGHYAEMVREARRRRRLIDGTQTDWLVLRNRLTADGSRNARQMAESLNQLSMRLGFRLAEGASERVLYRELFLCGLTMLDDIGLLASGGRPGHSPTGGRDEVRKLVESLKLPLDERGRRRAAARAEWARFNAAPIEVDDLIAD